MNSNGYTLRLKSIDLTSSQLKSLREIRTKTLTNSKAKSNSQSTKIEKQIELNFKTVFNGRF